MSVDVPLRDEPAPLPETGPPDAVMGAAECAERVAAAVEALPAIFAVRQELSSVELACLTRDALAVLQFAESATVGLVTEAVQRGLVNESTAAGATQWVSRLGAGEPVTGLLAETAAGRAGGPLVPVDVPDRPGGHGPGADADLDDEASGRRLVPGLEPVLASRIAKVATACTQRRNEVLTSAVAANQVGVPAARAALIEVDRVMPVLPAATRDQVFGHFLALPAGSGARAVRELSTRVIATFADEDFLVDADAKLDAAESVTWSDLPNGMTRLVADLAPLHAAQLRHAVEALSGPAPGNSCCDDVFHRHTGDKTGEPDDRTPGKRRADALMLLVTRAADLIDGDTTVPTSGQGRLVVTIGLEELTGALQGFGRTEAGTALDPHLVRQMACDANILPMVLGSHSEPLDVGREQRLVKAGMRTAVIERDRHCTYPGCGRPPSWCQVHHVTPWTQGGSTSLTNSALLCPRHHTIVHRDGYTATVSDTGVVWDLTPGRMKTFERVA